MNAKKNAFTLIELLIVVAIIGILAAIAVPNFLQAQTRAKVAKAVSNMKAVETGLEMYYLDKGSYPRWAWDGWGNPAAHYTGFRDLTTPVTYITGDSAFRNPFKVEYINDIKVPDGRELDPFFELGTFHYEGSNVSGRAVTPFDHSTFPRNVWMLESSGPDSADDYNGHNYPQYGVAYNTSNGLMSRGDIFHGGGVYVAEWVGKLPF